jgi:hypothetical protein
MTPAVMDKGSMYSQCPSAASGDEVYVAANILRALAAWNKGAEEWLYVSFRLYGGGIWTDASDR